MSRGDAFLLKVSDGAEHPVFRTLAGLRITGWFIGDGGRGNMTVGTTGIFIGQAGESLVTSHALNETIDRYELSFEDGRKVRGDFLVTEFALDGVFNGEPQYRLRLESVGKAVNVA